MNIAAADSQIWLQFLLSYSETPSYIPIEKGKLPRDVTTAGLVEFDGSSKASVKLLTGDAEQIAWSLL